MRLESHDYETLAIKTQESMNIWKFW